MLDSKCDQPLLLATQPLFPLQPGIATLSGGITVTGGSIKLDEAGTLGATVSMSGGTLDVDKTLTISGALSQYRHDIRIDVAS